VNCVLAGKTYGQPFGLDIAFADPIFGEPDIIVADDILGFAGIEPPSRASPVSTGHLRGGRASVDSARCATRSVQPVRSRP
jgi:hypothetical protein